MATNRPDVVLKVNKVLQSYAYSGRSSPPVHVSESTSDELHIRNDDIVDILADLRISIDRKDLPLLSPSNVKTDSGGIIRRDDFMKIYDAAKILVMFKELDQDGGGYISEDEISSAMKKLGYKISQKQCSSMMEKLDRNHDGQITFDEFLLFFSAFPHDSYAKMAETWLNASSPCDCGGDISPTLPAAGLFWWQTVLAGGCAGVLARTLTAPLERIKIAAQTGRTQGRGLWQELVSVYRTAGLRGLFAGNAANCVRVFPTAGLTCTVYLNLLALTPADDEFDAMEPVYRGGCAGAAALVANSLTYPLDVIRARLTVAAPPSGSKSIAHSFRDILNEGGWRGLYRGLRPTLTAVVPFIAIQNASIDILRDKAMSEGLPAGQSLLIGVGAVAGIAAQAVVYPLDVLRRRVQLAGVPLSAPDAVSAEARQVLSDRTWLALRQTVRTHGIGSLFAGIVPTFMKTVPSVATIAVVTGSINTFFKKKNRELTKIGAKTVIGQRVK